MFRQRIPRQFLGFRHTYGLSPLPRTDPLRVSGAVSFRFLLCPMHAAQRSPYRHLLKPKAGAMALALSVLGAKFHSFVDVTIVYPEGPPTFWDFLCGRMGKVVVRVRLLEVPADMLQGDYATDPRFRKAIQRWQQERWREKDEQIEALLVAEGKIRPATEVSPTAGAPTGT